MIRRWLHRYQADIPSSGAVTALAVALGLSFAVFLTTGVHGLAAMLAAA